MQADHLTHLRQVFAALPNASSTALTSTLEAMAKAGNLSLFQLVLDEGLVDFTSRNREAIGFAALPLLQTSGDPDGAKKLVQSWMAACGADSVSVINERLKLSNTEQEVRDLVSLGGDPLAVLPGSRMTVLGEALSRNHETGVCTLLDILRERGQLPVDEVGGNFFRSLGQIESKKNAAVGSRRWQVVAREKIAEHLCAKDLPDDWREEVGRALLSIGSGSIDYEGAPLLGDAGLLKAHLVLMGCAKIPSPKSWSDVFANDSAAEEIGHALVSQEEGDLKFRVVANMLEAGLDPDAIPARGSKKGFTCTLLVAAVQEKNAAMAKILLEGGANPERRLFANINFEEKTLDCFEYVERFGSPDLKQVFSAWRAKEAVASVVRTAAASNNGLVS